MIDDNYVSLFGDYIECLDILVFFVDGTNQFQGDLILEVDCKVSKKEYTFLDYFDISLKYKVLFNSRIHKLQKFCLLVLL